MRGRTSIELRGQFGKGIPYYEEFQYPGGETQIRLTDATKELIQHHLHIQVVARIRNAQDIVSLVMLKSAIDSVSQPGQQVTLFLPYLPYGRADRRFVEGDCFGLRAFLGMIENSFDAIYTLDAHSKVAEQAGLYDLPADGLIVESIQDFAAKHNTSRITVMFPDEGAEKRYRAENYQRVLGTTTIDVVHCTKQRDPETGKLLGFGVPLEELSPNPVLIVDDICDGGGTFLGIAHTMGGGWPLGLYVTHGIFSKGVDTLQTAFKHIYTTDSFREWQSSDGFKVYQVG